MSNYLNERGIKWYLVRCRKDNCAFAHRISIALPHASVRDSLMLDEDIDKAADIFLTLWQENIRLWATEKELLTPQELAALLEAASAAEKGQQHG
jgi:hypothetical protein